MRILVVGHEGYLGGSIYKYLALNNTVFGWGSSEGMENLNSSILSSMNLDMVLNFAVASERSENHYFIGSKSEQVNVIATASLFKSIQEANLPVIHISTKDVYGECYGKMDVCDVPWGYSPLKLIDDDAPFNPITRYGKTKLISEFLVEHCDRYAVIRLSSAYGDTHLKNGNWMSNIIRKMILNETLDLAKEGRQFRDPLHIADLAQLIKIIFFSNAWGIKINAGGGENNIISLIEYTSLVGNALKDRGKLYSIPINYVEGGDYGFAFNNRLARGLGWEPKIMVRDSIGILVDRSLNL